MQDSSNLSGFNSMDMINQQHGYFDSEQPQNHRRSSLGNIGLQSSHLNEFASLTLHQGFSESQSLISGIQDNVNLLQYNQPRQHQENINNFLRQYTFNEIEPPAPQLTFQSNLLIPPHYRSFQCKPASELRRNSFCASTLRPVQESRPSSPIQFSPHNQKKVQKHQQIQQRIDSSMYSSRDTNNPCSRFARKLSLDSSVLNAFKSRARGTSVGSTGSFESSGSLSRLEVNEEKLAKTGNMFQRREDWSIIGKLPVNKHNAIHIRLEDEGPYGNDETRCFVLSHFSLLGIRDMECVFCGCELIVYDRFPLIDGTLFVSPFLYDQKKAVPAVISNRDQYIYATCLKCLSGTNKDHEIKCKFCHKPWSIGSSLQIGTLYKYDIFASEPCCPVRVACKHCKKPLIDLKSSGGLPYFSMYSEQRECTNCKSRDFHFIRPLNEIYSKSGCELKRELAKEEETKSTKVTEYVTESAEDEEG